MDESNEQQKNFSNYIKDVLKQASSGNMSIHDLQSKKDFLYSVHNTMLLHKDIELANTIMQKRTHYSNFIVSRNELNNMEIKCENSEKKYQEDIEYVKKLCKDRINSVREQLDSRFYELAAEISELQERNQELEKKMEVLAENEKRYYSVLGEYELYKESCELNQKIEDLTQEEEELKAKMETKNKYSKSLAETKFGYKKK